MAGTPRQDAAGLAEQGEISRLTEQRSSLKRLTRDVMVWIGLLRHKALSLRALSGRAGDGLVPGSLDPRALADELAAGLIRKGPAGSGHTAPTSLADVQEAIDRARALWDTAVDPSDPCACERISVAADDLAAQLEGWVNDALDQYRKLGDELVRALKSGASRGGVRARAAAAGATETDVTDAHPESRPGPKA